MMRLLVLTSLFFLSPSVWAGPFPDGLLSADDFIQIAVKPYRDYYRNIIAEKLDCRTSDPNIKRCYEYPKPGQGESLRFDLSERAFDGKTQYEMTVTSRGARAVHVALRLCDGRDRDWKPSDLMKFEFPSAGASSCYTLTIGNQLSIHSVVQGGRRVTNVILAVNYKFTVIEQKGEKAIYRRWIAVYHGSVAPEMFVLSQFRADEWQHRYYFHQPGNEIGAGAFKDLFKQIFSSGYFVLAPMAFRIVSSTALWPNPHP